METLAAKSTVLRRVLATVACVAAFAVMASVFSPDRSRAGDVNNPWPGVPPRSVEYASPVAGGAERDLAEPESVDPHQGLQSLGSIEDRGYTVRIYATQAGPRYSVYERASGRECGALLTESQVHQAFPDLQLPTMEFNGNPSLMLAEPSDGLWW